jgi:hypothetical protein
MTVMDPVGDRELLYEARVDLNKVVEFGASLDALVSGQSPPLEGARFDIEFTGEVTGARLAGTVAGVDYVHVRADGRFQLHIHAVVTTADGANVSMFADGVTVPGAEAHVLDLRENITLTTSAEAYRWVNPLQIWGTGTVDLQVMQVRVRAYVA